MLPISFLFLAITIRLASGIGYIAATFTGRAKPNPVTWFIWGLTAMIAFAAQLQAHVGPQVWVTFALGLGPLTIFCLSALKHHRTWRLSPLDVACGALALLGIVLWQAVHAPILALICSILADALGGVPTVVKAYRHPQSEFALPYLLSMASMMITLATIRHWQFASYAFPAYIWLINAVIFSVLMWRSGSHLRLWTAGRRWLMMRLEPGT